MPTASPPADRYPEWLVGRAFVISLTDDRRHVSLGRIGLPERIRLDDAWIVGIFGDQVMTLPDLETPQVASVWSFEMGTVVRTIPLPETLVDVRHLDQAADVGLVTTGKGGVAAISAIDGSVRWLREPGAGIADQRTPALVISESGDELGYSVCSWGIEFAYGCDPLEIRRVSNGHATGRVDTHGEPVAAFAEAWVLTAAGRTSARDRAGHLLWTSDDIGLGLPLWHIEVLAARRVLVTTGDLSGGARHQLASVDPITGKYTVQYDPGRGVMWTYWQDLSNDRFIAIGDANEFADFCGLMSGEGCGPDGRAVVSDLLDLETGKVRRGAIQITLTP